jgi:uncharacterized damage-inducible protein DinB
MTSVPTTIAATSRAARLADDLAAVNAAVISAIEGCSDEEWRRPTAAEGWPVAVVAHHVAEVERFFAGALGAAVAGEAVPPALTSEAVEQNNRRHAAENANAGKAETLAALRDAGPALVNLLRGLDEAQLDRAAVIFDDQPLTVAQVAEFALVAHVGEHLASIRATIAA